MRRYFYALICLVSIAAAPASASSITFNGSSGSLSASVTFSTSGANLLMTFTNTSTNDVLVPSDVLTAFFFNSTGIALSLTPATGSVVLNTGSTVLFGGSDPGGVVGGEWDYRSGISGGAPAGANYGVSSVGLNIFGNASFPGSNLQGPVSVDGLQYGLTSAGDNPATGNTPVTGTNALIKNSVVITLPGIPAGYDPSAHITNVWFQYGTALDGEPGFPGTPEPSTLSMLIVGVFALRRRRLA